MHCFVLSVVIWLAAIIWLAATFRSMWEESSSSWWDYSSYTAPHGSKCPVEGCTDRAKTWNPNRPKNNFCRAWDGPFCGNHCPDVMTTCWAHCKDRCGSKRRRSAQAAALRQGSYVVFPALLRLRDILNDNIQPTHWELQGITKERHKVRHIAKCIFAHIFGGREVDPVLIQSMPGWVWEQHVSSVENMIGEQRFWGHCCGVCLTLGLPRVRRIPPS